MPVATADEQSNPLAEPVRPNYFTGKLLSADDLAAEQAYHRGMRRLHNRATLGSGVVWGLGVIRNDDGTVTVSPGLAVDPLGREIVLPAPVTIDPWSTDPDGHPATGQEPASDVRTIWLSYCEEGRDPTPAANGVLPGSIAETFQIVVRAAAGAAAEPTDQLPADGTTPNDQLVVLATMTTDNVDESVRRRVGVHAQLDQLAELVGQVTELSARVNSLIGQVSTLTGQVSALTDRVEELSR